MIIWNDFCFDEVLGPILVERTRNVGLAIMDDCQFQETSRDLDSARMVESSGLESYSHSGMDAAQAHIRSLRQGGGIG